MLERAPVCREILARDDEDVGLDEDVVVPGDVGGAEVRGRVPPQAVDVGLEEGGNSSSITNWCTARGAGVTSRSPCTTS